MKRLILILALLFSAPVLAQTPVAPTFINPNGGRTTTGTADPFPVSGGFRVQAFGTPISVTTSNSTGTIPAGTVVIATNVGSTAAYCALGASATTSSQYIAAGGSFPFIIGTATQLTCVTASSTTTINITGGTGLTASGGGGSGGGSGGGTSSSFGAAFPSTGTAIGFTDGSNMVAGRVGAVSNVAAATTFVDSLAVGQYLASAPTLTDTRYQHFLLDVNGNLKVNVVNANANGQATMANSSPVVIASNQASIPVAATLGAETTKVIGTINVAAAQTIAVSNTSATSAYVINGGSAYETVAASQTGQALGATGGTGDYLSHCVIYPTTTTPGVVTVFDNSSAAGTNVIAFPGGASSVSNLAPIAIPVGAISTAGAWKVTTGANLVVTCYGRFT